jgi:hypothetical protein
MASRPSQKIKSDLFVRDFTPNSVYILGLLWADGYLTKKHNSIQIECVKEDINYFYPIFKTTGDYSLTFRHRENRREQGCIYCSSVEVANFLKMNDYLIKSKTTPSKILNIIPKELHSYFFLGWSDGDGCFYYNNTKSLIQYVISGSYEQNWESLTTLCDTLGIEYKIDKFITKKNHKYSRFLIAKNIDILKFGNYIYQDLKLGLPRKIQKFKDITEYILEKKVPIYHCYDMNNNLINEFRTVRLASDWLNLGKDVKSSIRDCFNGRQKTYSGYIWTRTYTQAKYFLNQ